MSTGSFELRADGKFHEWTIFNQHPAGAAKIQFMEDMFMGVRAQVRPKVTVVMPMVSKVRLGGSMCPQLVSKSHIGPFLASGLIRLVGCGWLTVTSAN